MRGYSSWLNGISIAALVVAALSAAVILLDILRGHRQKMAVMNWVWPITGLYLGPLAVWAYWSFGRSPTAGTQQPLWQIVFKGSCHCGAGCTLGDVTAEWAVFLTGFTIAGSTLLAEDVSDFAAAYVIGIVFQYYAIAPMRNLRGWLGIEAAVKADTISLAAFEAGMFLWMWLARALIFRTMPDPTGPVYWFSMQIAMVIGLITAFPANWWLIQHGWKEKM